MKKEELTLRLARPDEDQRVLDFINDHFDWKLPLVNRPEYFDYYYRFDNKLQFAIAESEGRMLAVAGYILANRCEHPDLWVSVWVAEKGHNGTGLELMNALPELTGARVVACNNIRPETRPFYEFLGWTTGRIPHYYRLADRSEYRLAKPVSTQRLPVSGDLELSPVMGPVHLGGMGHMNTEHTPFKDLWYLTRRYFGFPHRTYQGYFVCEKGKVLGYLVVHIVEAYWEDPTQEPVKVMRIVDCLGDYSALPRVGKAIDQLMEQEGVEYADFYCYGIDPAIMAAAGFSERKEGDGTIIPNYLTPIAQENTEYYFFTNKPEGFTMFKADGDQDRPNLPAY